MFALDKPLAFEALLVKLGHLFFRVPDRSSVGTQTEAEGMRLLPHGSFLSPTRQRFLSSDPGYSTSTIPLTLGPFDDGPRWTSSEDSSLRDNVEYRNGRLVGATIAILVKRMTPVNLPVDATFSNVFFLTFRLFSSPKELAETLIDRYCLLPPKDLAPEDFEYWQREIGSSIRRHVFEFIQTWLENYWVPTVDDSAIPVLKALVNKRSTRDLPPWSAYVVQNTLHKRTPSDINTTIDVRSPSPGFFVNQFEDDGNPKVLMTKSLRAHLKRGKFNRISIEAFDPLELARQLTILESELFCAVRPDEILRAGEDDFSPAKSIQAINLFGTIVTRWVTESIIGKRYHFTRRIFLVNFFIKVAYNCAKLNNFSTSGSILAALNSSQVLRLQWTLNCLSRKQKAQLRFLRKLLDCSNNHSEYRDKLKDVVAPAIPCLGPYVMDITFCRDCYPSYRRASPDPKMRVINLSKYYKLAAIVQEIQRFQVPYKLQAVVGFQDYLTSVFTRYKQS